MKLQRTTLILLSSALLLGGFVYFYEVQGATQREAVKTTKKPLFSFKEDQIQSLTIYTKDETLDFERVSQEEVGWQMKTPKNTPASAAAVSFLSDLLVDGKIERSFPVPTTQRQEYGLDQPLATVKIQLKNKETHRLILGKPDFNRSFLYAQADPPSQTPQQMEVLLVPIDFEYAVKRPLSEWQHQAEKPKSAEESPTPSESSTPSSTPDSSEELPNSLDSSKELPTPDSSKKPSAEEKE